MELDEQLNGINRVIAEFFRRNPGVDKIRSKELMGDFIRAGIFTHDHREGLPIRNLLRTLDDENRLDVIPSVLPERKKVNTNWYFIRRSL